MRYRGRRGPFRPWIWIWVLIFPFSYMSHSWIGIVVGVALILLIALIVRFVLASAFNGANGSMMWGNQPPRYRQPTESPYQPYQPYQEGYQEYQPSQEPNGEDWSRGQNQPLQPQYEEPQIQYPEEMPPMQQ